MKTYSINDALLQACCSMHPAAHTRALDAVSSWIHTINRVSQQNGAADDLSFVVEDLVRHVMIA